jgi:hypothetical protein
VQDRRKDEPPFGGDDAAVIAEFLAPPRSVYVCASGESFELNGARFTEPSRPEHDRYFEGER